MLLLTALVLGGVTACVDGEEAPPGPAIVTDTLEGGGLHVRNPAEGVWEATGNPAVAA